MTEPEVLAGVELYLAYFEEAKALHLREFGRPLEMYKHTEPACLERVFGELVSSPLNGVDFLVELLHTLAWRQCLGNANHRTSILFVGDHLDAEMATGFDGALFASRTDAWIIASQTIIRRRGEWGYAQADLEKRHRERTRDWVVQTFPQSEALMMIGPKRLLNFLSGKSSSRERRG